MRQQGHFSAVRRAQQAKLTARASAVGQLQTIDIHDLTHDGRGVGHWQGKAIFVAGALPGEQVKVKITHEKSQYAQAVIQQQITFSEQRIAPTCAHFLQCGGCQLQHLAHHDQLAFKQQQLQRNVTQAQLSTKQLEWHSPLVGEAWQYRRRVRFVLNKQGQLCLRAQGGQQQVVIEQCPQLVESLHNLHQLLSTALTRLPWKGINEIELLSIGEEAIILHTNRQWRERDAEIWLAWCQQQAIAGCYLQPSEREATLVTLQAAHLHYQLNDLTFQLTPDQFVQTHHNINEQMVALANDWLAADERSQVVELFCGMGNFSLSIARRLTHLVALELSAVSIQTAERNALNNDIHHIDFRQADLFDRSWRLPKGATHVLLDPPRDGALHACERIAKQKSVHHVVYVSCHPATMTRDMAVLQQHGFVLRRLALIDQFPQTYHIEAMALLQRSTG